MRQSNRVKILGAAAEVIHREGIGGVTLDSVAAEAGVTRGGLMYHFPTREALVLAIHQHLATQWEEQLVATAGKPAEQATVEERMAAYARTCGQTTTRAELLFMLESSTLPEHFAVWTDVIDRWNPPIPGASDGTAALVRFIARLAADGLWMHQSIVAPLTPELRRVVVEQIVRLIVTPTTATAAPPDDRSTSGH